MDKNRLFYLIDQVNKGIATPEEIAEYDSSLNQLTATKSEWDSHSLGQEEQTREELRAMLYRQIAQQPARRVRLWPRIAAVAASVLLLVGTGTYFLLHKPQEKPQLAYQNDVKPGANGAILTLSNGTKIVLEQAKSGTIARQNGSRVNKASDSLLEYQPGTTKAVLTYNTLETPKGRQVEVVLPDGSQVWLNAGSSLKYPTAFGAKERLVELTGEAYFKVSANPSRPFRVKTANQLTEDMGTEFDINAYVDEPEQQTTLIEGAIKVNAQLLKPGQASDGKTIRTANIAEVTAWKNGEFDFENAGIATVMRQLSRWYDIDVQYQGKVTGEGFNAIISRHKNISSVLRLLEQTQGVHFKIEGRRVTVMQ